jgi:hypothetical protein
LKSIHDVPALGELWVVTAKRETKENKKRFEL